MQQWSEWKPKRELVLVVVMMLQFNTNFFRSWHHMRFYGSSYGWRKSKKKPLVNTSSKKFFSFCVEGFHFGEFYLNPYVAPSFLVGSCFSGTTKLEIEAPTGTERRACAGGGAQQCTWTKIPVRVVCDAMPHVEVLQILLGTIYLFSCLLCFGDAQLEIEVRWGETHFRLRLCSYVDSPLFLSPEKLHLPLIRKLWAAFLWIVSKVSKTPKS